MFLKARARHHWPSPCAIRTDHAVNSRKCPVDVSLRLLKYVLTRIPPFSMAKGNNQIKSNGSQLGFETTLWAAADKLRGNHDAAEYKHVVLGLIFLKYIALNRN